MTVHVRLSAGQDYKFSEEAAECFGGDFRAVRHKQACFLMTKIYPYIRTQTHNPPTYCARVTIVYYMCTGDY